MALDLIDWLAVALLVLAVSGVAAAIAVLLSRRHLARELESVLGRMEAFGTRLKAMEEHAREQQRLPAMAPIAAQPSSSVLERPQWRQEAGMPERSMETLTRHAAAALASLDAFRRFAAVEGGNGLVVPLGKQVHEPVSTPDPVSAADLWAVELDGEWLLFPGYNLRRSQSALLADSGRMARERLGWLFHIEAGEQFVAFKPAIQRGNHIDKGLLTLPF